MYPYGFHHHHFRGPSRIFWFILGAGVASFWHCSRDIRDRRAQYFPCVMQSRDSRRLNGDSPIDEHPTPPVYSKPDSTAPQENRWNFALRSGQPSHNRDGTWGWNQQEWEADRERMKDIQKRAEDAMLDMSESTLESIVSTLESLKSKLTEQKSQREQHRKKHEEELEKLQNEPRRFV